MRWRKTKINAFELKRQKICSVLFALFSFNNNKPTVCNCYIMNRLMVFRFKTWRSTDWFSSVSGNCCNKLYPCGIFNANKNSRSCSTWLFILSVSSSQRFFCKRRDHSYNWTPYKNQRDGKFHFFKHNNMKSSVNFFSLIQICSDFWWQLPNTSLFHYNIRQDKTRQVYF